MSITAVIRIKAKPEWQPGFEDKWCQKLVPETPDDATHEIDTGDLLYVIGYERGNWPHQVAVLLWLMQSKAIEWVRYGHDHGGTPPLMTPARLFEITAHWIEHGNRPYYEAMGRKQ